MTTEEFVNQALGPDFAVPKVAMTMNSLFAYYGSFRRVVEAYWYRQLSTDYEREIESNVPKEILIGFKPLSTPNPQ